MVVKIVLLRHPRPAIAPGLCYGALDVALHPDLDLPAILAPLAAFAGLPVWTSPQRRCREIAERLHPDPRRDERLRELNFGDWEGQAWDDLPRAELDRWACNPAAFAPPHGESGAALIDRVRSVHTDLRRANTDTIIVSHGGPLRLLASLLRGDPPDLLAPAPAWGAAILIDVREAAP